MEEETKEERSVFIQQSKLPTLSISVNKQEQGLVTAETNLMVKATDIDECIEGMNYLLKAYKNLTNGDKPPPKKRGEYVG